jgi:hypothetical protein
MKSTRERERERERGREREGGGGVLLIPNLHTTRSPFFGLTPSDLNVFLGLFYAAVSTWSTYVNGKTIRKLERHR